MDNIKRISEGLISYAVERQIGFENHRKDWDPVQPETRNGWVRNILRDMAEMDDNEATANLLDELDRRLEQAQECFAAEPASLRLQRETIRGLQSYITALEQREKDPRPQIQQVAKLLVDMSLCPDWDSKANGIHAVSNQAWDALPRLTAAQPIRFTRVLLGGDHGPSASNYVSGAVKTPEEAAKTKLYADLSSLHPEIECWPSICTVYACGRGPVHDATEFDLAIMREDGDRFHKRPGVNFVSEVEMKIPIDHAAKESKMLRIVKVEPGERPYEKRIPNELSSIRQEIGGGLFQPVYIGGGVMLCCNEEGKLNGMEPNRRLGDEDIICGPFFLVGDNGEGDLVSLTDEQAAACMDVFGEPQQFSGEEPELGLHIELYLM